MVSFLQLLPLTRGRGLGCPCCSTWLVELESESPSSASARTDCGLSSSLVVGSCVSYRRPNNRWAGLVPIASVGVFLSARTARYMSPLLSFALRRSRFASFTAASALPLVFWCPGLPVRCSKPHSFAKLVNFSQANCGPLSLITMSGIPCLANWHFKFLIMVLLFVFGKGSISQKFDK